MKKSDYENVKEFTEESTGVKLPDKPETMDKEEVGFLTKMIISELIEFCQTVTSSFDESCVMVQECLDEMKTRDKSKQPLLETTCDVIDAQMDAPVDIWYYSLNAFAKKGADLSAYFKLVHEANMDKRDLETGKFIIREEDGKILKREGWKPADTLGLVKSWM